MYKDTQYTQNTHGGWGRSLSSKFYPSWRISDLTILALLLKICLQCGRPPGRSWVVKIPGGKRNGTQYSLPGEFHGQREPGWLQSGCKSWTQPRQNHKLVSGDFSHRGLLQGTSVSVCVWELHVWYECVWVCQYFYIFFIGTLAFNPVFMLLLWILQIFQLPNILIYVLRLFWTNSNLVV